MAWELKVELGVVEPATIVIIIIMILVEPMLTLLLLLTKVIGFVKLYYWFEIGKYFPYSCFVDY